MKRTLELTIDLHEENFTLDIRDPESCAHNEFSFPHSSFDLADFNQTVGEEIYSWISFWQEGDIASVELDFRPSGCLNL